MNRLVLLSALLVCGCSKSVDLTGKWNVHLADHAEALTLSDDKGVLTGTIERSAGEKYDIHGIRSGANIEWSFRYYSASTTPGMSGDIDFTFKGEIEGRSMHGQFTIFGPFTPFISGADKSDLWVANHD